METKQVSSVRSISGRLRAWRQMALDLYGWEPIEAEKQVTVGHATAALKWHGPRREMPADYTEVSNQAGVHLEDMREFEEMNNVVEACEILDELISAATEAREELFRCGESSSSAYEHGDRVARGSADQYADEIHAKLDAAIAKATGTPLTPTATDGE